jgi:threonylcarbamoyladenosine tRNA methylthiotransferase MtaB
MRIYFTNLGCKLNQAEVEKLSRRFVAAGHALAAGLDEADLHVINSCTVTHLAARDSRKAARRGRRENPRLRTVLTGCMATAAPAEAARVAGVDLVVANDRKDDLLEIVHEAFPKSRPDAGGPLPIPYVPIDFGRARALVKVEDGCDMRCAFCIIPTTRGRQRSRRLEDVTAEVRALAAGGYPEIVVTGVQISEYHDEGRRLYDLVKALLEETPAPRLRLTSIAPWKLDRRLLGLWRDSRLCRHVHMSLQSGSTATLRRMRRPYTAGQYAALVDEIRAAVPGVAVTADVIVGFPGETAAEFAESLDFVARLQLAKPHVFTYSPRPGTDAATLPDQVPPAEKKARVAQMLAVAREGEHAFYRRHLGATLEVAWEEKKDGRWSGLTDNYIRVFAESEAALAGTLAPATLAEVVEGGATGRASAPRKS